jgi:hypothetical protein
MTRPHPSSLSAAVLAAWCAAVAPTVLSGCASRTVYVIDDRPTPAAAPGPAVLAESSDRVGGATAPPADAPPRFEDEAGIRDPSDFVEPLSPYGRFVDYPGYGAVFVPAVAVVGPRFRPYTHGHWEYTDWGWTWVDHHPFGWATGHYGRWFYDAGLGWVWVPGTTWAPAWVTWRTGGGYVGWAAMPPGSTWGGRYAVYDTSWVFVTTGNFGVGYVGGVLITGPAYRSCYGATVVRHDTVVYYDRTVYRGPDYDDVRRSGTVIHRPLRETDRERPVSRPPPSVSSRRRDRPATTTPAPRDEDVTRRPRDRGDDQPAAGDNARDAARDDETSGRSRDRSDAGARDAPVDRARDAARDARRDAAAESPRDAAIDGARDAVRDGARDAAIDGAREAVRDDARESANETGRDAAAVDDGPAGAARDGDGADREPVPGDPGSAGDRATPPVDRVPAGAGRGALDRAPEAPTKPPTRADDAEDNERAPRPPLVPMPARPLPTKELLDDPARLRDVTRPPAVAPRTPAAPTPSTPTPSPPSPSLRPVREPPPVTPPPRTPSPSSQRSPIPPTREAPLPPSRPSPRPPTKAPSSTRPTMPAPAAPRPTTAPEKKEEKKETKKADKKKAPAPPKKGR